MTYSGLEADLEKIISRAQTALEELRAGRTETTWEVEMVEGIIPVDYPVNPFLLALRDLTSGLTISSELWAEEIDFLEARDEYYREVTDAKWRLEETNG